MKKLYFALLAVVSTTQVFAHEGHGVDASSVFHLLSAPHVFVPVALGLSVVAIGCLILRFRRQRR